VSAVQSISGFFPCYNDAESMPDLVAKLDNALATLEVPYEVIVVDDGSTDDSVKVLQGLIERFPMLRVVEHKVNRGYGGALRTGFNESKHQWVFYTDGDGQYDPSEVLKLVEAARDDVDWVQGYKTSRGDPMYRIVVGRLYHHWVKFWFRIPVRDTDCDFRLIRQSLLDQVVLTSSTGTICAEMMYRFRQVGARVVEVPVNHFERPYGRSQFFRVRRVVKSLMDLARLWVRVTFVERRAYPKG
jgi:glycosyltransferase involved in cell wall biosynthesis